MPHAAYPTSLVANGIDLTRSDGRIIGQVTRGLIEQWEVRGKDTIVPALAGRVPRNRIRDRLMIEYTGHVMGAGANEDAQREDFRDLMDSIRTLMDPTSDPYDLVATMEDGSTRTITARPTPNGIVPGNDDIPSYLLISLQWESVDSADWSVAGS